MKIHQAALVPALDEDTLYEIEGIVSFIHMVYGHLPQALDTAYRRFAEILVAGGMPEEEAIRIAQQSGGDGNPAAGNAGNHGKHLRQTYRDLQVCVYDNASSDETGRVIAGFAQSDDRVRYHRQPVNIGGFDNFSYGMARVETEFFSFLSDDDVLYPQFLEAAVAALERHPDAMMFAGSTLELGEDGRLQYAPVARWPREGRYDPPEGARAMLGNKHPTWTAVLFRRASIERLGLIDPQTGACSDLDYELQIAAHFPIVVSYQPCAAFVRHGQAYSMREDTSVISGYRRMAEKFAADSGLAPAGRAGMARSLARQTSTKLVEIAANHNLELASRNLEGVKLVAPHALQPYDLLRHDRLLLSKDAAVRLGETLGLGPRSAAPAADVVTIESAKPAEPPKAAKPAAKPKP